MLLSGGTGLGATFDTHQSHSSKSAFMLKTQHGESIVFEAAIEGRQGSLDIGHSYHSNRARRQA